MKLTEKEAQVLADNLNAIRERAVAVKNVGLTIRKSYAASGQMIATSSKMIEELVKTCETIIESKGK